MSRARKIMGIIWLGSLVLWLVAVVWLIASAEVAWWQGA